MENNNLEITKLKRLIIILFVMVLILVVAVIVVALLLVGKNSNKEEITTTESTTVIKENPTETTTITTTDITTTTTTTVSSTTRNTTVKTTKATVKHTSTKKVTYYCEDPKAKLNGKYCEEEVYIYPTKRHGCEPPYVQSGDWCYIYSSTVDKITTNGTYYYCPGLYKEDPNKGDGICYKYTNVADYDYCPDGYTKILINRGMSSSHWECRTTNRYPALEREE